MIYFEEILNLHILLEVKCFYVKYLSEKLLKETEVLKHFKLISLTYVNEPRQKTWIYN